MAELTKEKILQLAFEFVSKMGRPPWLSVNDSNRIIAQTFYFAGMHEFAKMLIEELETSND